MDRRRRVLGASRRPQVAHAGPRARSGRPRRRRRARARCGLAGVDGERRSHGRRDRNWSSRPRNVQTRLQQCAEYRLLPSAVQTAVAWSIPVVLAFGGCRGSRAPAALGQRAGHEERQCQSRSRAQAELRCSRRRSRSARPRAAATTTARRQRRRREGRAKIALLLPGDQDHALRAAGPPDLRGRVKELCADCESSTPTPTRTPPSSSSRPSRRSPRRQGDRPRRGRRQVARRASSTRAKQTKIPVICYDRLVSDADLDYYVSIDPFKVGQQQGKALLDALKGAGKSSPSIVMINGSPTDNNAGPTRRARTPSSIRRASRWSRSTTRPTGAPTRPSARWSRRSPALGKDGVRRRLRRQRRHGRRRDRRDEGRRHRPGRGPVTGQDAEVAGVQRILAGEQLMTVYQADQAQMPRRPPSSPSRSPRARSRRTSPRRGRQRQGEGPVGAARSDRDHQGQHRRHGRSRTASSSPSEICTGKYARPCEEAGIQ